ncbi:MAG TPA: hypothetical protein VLU95_08705 [Candidatus Acidoferrum sp.]|nr:hypothetical protein [Candidatus Acidoferrum sp.]
MPKTYLKTYPKKTKPKKIKSKVQSKPVSLFRSKYYWITLTAIMIAFTIAFGYIMQIAFEKEALIFSTILVAIGFAFYVGFKQTVSYPKRAVFFFVGASIIGFCIWAAIVLSFGATGINEQVASSIGIDLFAVTSLIICLISGALIGDLIGKNKEKLVSFTNKFRS